VYRWGLRRGYSFSLGLQNTIYQAEMYAIRVYIMDNIEKATQVGTSIFILSVGQPSRPLIASR
jgi:hypothetical protein